MKKFLKTGIPLILCVLIFAYIFHRIPPQQALKALVASNIPLFIFVSILYFFWVHIFDCLTIKHFISRFSAPISHKESWLVRGATYLIMIINYHAAQGAFAIYFKKTHKAPITKSLGVLAFISLADLVLILTSAVIALFFTNVTFAGFDFRVYVLKLAPLIYVFYFLFVLLWKNVNKPFIQKLARYTVINWIIKHDVFLIFREASLKDFALVFLMRLPIIIAVVGGYNMALYSFGALIPWKILFLYNPLIMLISTLPITPAGLGTGQFLTIEFFQSHVAGLSGLPLIETASLLLASSLLWFLANQIIKVVFGAVCLLWTSLDRFKSQEIF